MGPELVLSFFGPESDHWPCLSLIDLLTNSLTPKKMVALAMSLIVEKVVANFLYTFAGQDRRQQFYAIAEELRLQRILPS